MMKNIGTVTIRALGRVTIPVQCRNNLGLMPKTQCTIWVDDQKIYISNKDDGSYNAEIDRYGRIVIVKEIRDFLFIHDEDEFYVNIDEECMMLEKKHMSFSLLSKEIDKLVANSDLLTKEEKFFMSIQLQQLYKEKIARSNKEIIVIGRDKIGMCVFMATFKSVSAANSFCKRNEWKYDDGETSCKLKILKMKGKEYGKSSNN